VIVKAQLAPCPAHAPVHCLKTAPASGFAVSVTLSWYAKESEQIEPQLMPVVSV
jgi:hypothetical protein